MKIVRLDSKKEWRAIWYPLKWIYSNLNVCDMEQRECSWIGD